MHNIFFAFLLSPLFVFSQIDPVLQEWKKDKDLKQASIGFCVLDTKSGALLAEYNAHQLFTPASTLKVVSTSAALGLLGANYRYETRLYYRGDYNSSTGVLNGDLVIAGSGDPSLQSDNFASESVSVTDKWAKVLKDKGLKEIKGKIIGDASFFDRRVPANWIWEDISNYFGAVPCGLSYKDNKFKVFYTTKEAGSEAKITGHTAAYKSHTLNLVSEVIAKGSEDQAYAYGDPFSYNREIRGTLPPNKNNYEIEVALPDPALLCAEDLLSSLQQLGVKCDPAAATSSYQRSADAKGQLMYTHYSPTLDRLVYFTNLTSNNHYCETLLRTVGKGKTDAGLKAVKSYWQSRGLDTNELYMEDASGLARIDAVTPYYQASLLSKVARDSALYKVFNASLPLAGRQGSMSSIGKGKFIENNLRAKTGYLTRVRAYCGYVRTKSGRDLAFSLIVNHYNCTPRETRLKMEKFMVALGDL